MASMFIERSADSARPLTVCALNEKDGEVLAVVGTLRPCFCFTPPLLSPIPEVVGCMVNEDWKDKQPQAYKNLNSDSWRPVLSLIHI